MQAMEANEAWTSQIEQTTASKVPTSMRMISQMMILQSTSPEYCPTSTHHLSHYPINWPQEIPTKMTMILTMKMMTQMATTTQALARMMLITKTPPVDTSDQMNDLSNTTKTHQSTFPPINITPNGQQPRWQWWHSHLLACQWLQLWPHCSCWCHWQQ